MKLGEVRESQETQRCDVASVKEISQPKRNKKKRASKTAAAGQLVDFLSEMQKQQQETMNDFMVGMQKIKKKRASKTAAAGQLVDFLSEMQKQQQETMNDFMVGMQKIEESSRKHTANLLLGFAKIFAESNSSKGRKRNRQSDSEDSD